jgi:hypothetical protein
MNAIDELRYMGQENPASPENLEELRNKAEEQRKVDNHKEELESKKNLRDLKKKYATWLFGLLAVEILLIFGIVIAQGFKCIEIEQWLLALIFETVIAQSFGLVLLVTKHLFPVEKDK